MTEPRLAFDTSAFNLFIEANSGRWSPRHERKKRLADEKLATFRLFLCRELWIVPTVARETLAARDASQRDEHFRFVSFHFEELLPEGLDNERVNDVAAQAACLHLGERHAADCHVLAEAVVGGLDALVVWDRAFRTAIGSRFHPFEVLAPTEAWDRWAVPQTLARWQPAEGHPLCDATWWRWE